MICATRRAWTVLALVCVMAVGCGPTQQPKGRMVDTAAKPKAACSVSPSIAQRAIDAIGGEAAWRPVIRIAATALVTVYDADGTGHVTRQHQVIDLRSGMLTAEGVSPRGRWSVMLDADGQARWLGADAIAQPQQRQLIERALRRIQLRSVATWRLWRAPEQLGAGAPARVEGLDLIRVEEIDPATDVNTYYVDGGTGLLRYVVAGPGADATVTTFEYQPVSGALLHPRVLRVVHVGEHTLVGPTPVLEATFTDVVFGRTETVRGSGR